LFSIVAFTDISQGSVAKHLRYDAIFNDSIITRVFLIQPANKAWKSVSIWRS